MTPERWQRLNELFQSALERPEAERELFLAQACGADTALRSEVVSLVAAHRAAGDFIEGPASGSVASSAEDSDPALLPGRRLGPYEIVALLGAGGMGQVYRARDPRLRRDVAIKVLPPGRRSADESHRLEREARAAAALSHPNVVAVHDVGREGDLVYVVSELLEGETLRERLRGGALPWRRAVEHAAQIARGLAAAHDRGLVHRDVKPENVLVTRDGRAKLLDFGLARRTAAELSAPGATGAALALDTRPGTIMGSVGYMSPEQVRGEAADARSDIFAFGALLYEMLTGRRAFRGDHALEVLHAILHGDPPDLLQARPELPAVLARVVTRCLERLPENRFRSAHDLCFSLESLADGSASTPAPAPQRAARRSRVKATIGWAVAATTLAAGGLLAGLRIADRPPPSFHQLTFQRGAVQAARFAPDGHSVLYGAAWNGADTRVFSRRLDGVEARPLGLSRARLIAVAPGELAVVLAAAGGAGTLARVPLEGGEPRELLDDVRAAAWTRDGSRFAVARGAPGRMRLEYPIGNVVFNNAGHIESPRISPGGDLVAFVNQSMLGNTPGALVVVDAAGRSRTLSDGWTDAGGVAWSPDGREVWFTAAKTGAARGVWAVSLAGKDRLVARMPGALVLQDIAADGRVLLTHAHHRSEALARLAGESGERDLSWFDWTHPCDLSADGRRLLFTAEGEAGGADYTIYLRRELDAAPVRLGTGHATELSPDGAWALAMLRRPRPRLLLLPTGTGVPAELPSIEGASEYHWAWWTPDGRRVIVLANKAGRSPQLFVLDRSQGSWRELAPEGVTSYRNKPVSPDGRFIVALAAHQEPARFVLWPLAGGEPQALMGLDATDQPLRWSGDGGSLFVRVAGAGLPIRIDRVDLATGRRSAWTELAPDDRAGVDHIGDVLLTADGRSAIFSAARELSELYLVEGLK